ncbi:MAG: hypothetical protein AAF738_04375, partial [Bacteroidota bacterium]
NAGDILFEVCFDVDTESSAEGTVTVNSEITGFLTEVINANSQELAILQKAATIKVRQEDRFTYPGDTNNDKLANHLDLLHLGLAYHAFGTDREGNDITWESKYSRNWGETSPLSNVNYKHCDANGDSEVNISDVIAIEQNWGKVADIEGNDYTPETYIGTTTLEMTAPEIIATQTTYALPIHLGTPTAPTQAAYGLAFSISYEHSLTDLSDSWVTMAMQDSWLGTLGEDLIAIQKHFPEEKRIDVALTRIDRVARNGAGQIGELAIILEDVLLVGTEKLEETITFKIHDVYLINAQEEATQVSESELALDVMPVMTSTNDIFSSSITHIYPSIASNYLQIESELPVELAQIRNMDGKIVASFEHISDVLHLENLACGSYTIQLHTFAGVSLHRFILQ